MLKLEISKEDWFKKKLRNGFFIFEKNESPKLTNTDYDPVLFEVINSAYLSKSRMGNLFMAIEKSIGFDDKKNTFKIDPSKSDLIIDALKKDRILEGMALFELNPKSNVHFDFLESLGAIIPEYVKNKSIAISGSDAIKLKNFENLVAEKFDITFSNGLMDENSGIKYESHSGTFSGFELYAIFANITKKNGFSIHSNGNIISSLYETYFQFIGFKVMEYFRNSDGNINFTMIMKKINEKSTNYDEFFYLYKELKSRWPTRYGN